MNFFQRAVSQKWASLFLLMTACAHRTFSDAKSSTQETGRDQESQETAQSIKKVEKIGLYGIDGSLNTCEPPEIKDLTIICQLLKDSKNSVQRYHEGVKDYKAASDQGKLDLNVAAEICADVRNGDVTKALIVGYSRGAVSALVVAANVNKNCPIGGEGVVRWLGLVDTVETSIWLYGRLPRDIGRERSIPDNVKALHLHKEPTKTKDDSFGIVSTTQLRIAPNTGSTLVTKTIKDISHDAIGRGIVNGKKLFGDSFSGYRILKQAAIDEGAVFLSGDVQKDADSDQPTNEGPL